MFISQSISNSDQDASSLPPQFFRQRSASIAESIPMSLLSHSSPFFSMQEQEALKQLYRRKQLSQKGIEQHHIHVLLVSNTKKQVHPCSKKPRVPTPTTPTSPRCMTATTSQQQQTSDCDDITCYEKPHVPFVRPITMKCCRNNNGPCCSNIAIGKFIKTVKFDDYCDNKDKSGFYGESTKQMHRKSVKLIKSNDSALEQDEHKNVRFMIHCEGICLSEAMLEEYDKQEKKKYDLVVICVNIEQSFAYFDEQAKQLITKTYQYLNLNEDDDASKKPTFLLYGTSVNGASSSQVGNEAEQVPEPSTACASTTTNATVAPTSVTTVVLSPRYCRVLSTEGRMVAQEIEARQYSDTLEMLVAQIVGAFCERKANHV